MYDDQSGEVNLLTKVGSSGEPCAALQCAHQPNADAEAPAYQADASPAHPIGGIDVLLAVVVRVYYLLKIVERLCNGSNTADWLPDGETGAWGALVLVLCLARGANLQRHPSTSASSVVSAARGWSHEDGDAEWNTWVVA
jgi:hypothetical protein